MIKSIKEIKLRRLKPQEKSLLKLLEDIKEVKTEIFPDSIFYKYENKVVFEKDNISNTLILDYYTFLDMSLLNNNNKDEFTENFNSLIYERFDSKNYKIKFTTSSHRSCWFIIECL